MGHLLALACCALFALLTLPAAADAARWQKLDTGRGGPSARADAALAAPSARFTYLHGGERDGSPLADLWRLDVRRERWTRLKPPGPAPAARFGHDLVAARDGSLLLFGGQSGADFFGDVWRYDPGAGRWTMLEATGPAPRYGAGVAYDRTGDALYVTHGFTNDGRFDDTWRLGRERAFADLSPAAPAPRPLERCLVGAVFSGDELFLFGGQSNPRPFLGDLWRYDTATSTWTELQPTRAPSPRNVYGSARLGSTWVIHGGQTRTGAAGDLWTLDLRNPASFARVRPRGARPSARANQAMTALGTTRAVTFGGSDDEGDSLRDTWLLRLP